MERLKYAKILEWESANRPLSVDEKYVLTSLGLGLLEVSLDLLAAAFHARRYYDVD